MRRTASMIFCSVDLHLIIIVNPWNSKVASPKTPTKYEETSIKNASEKIDKDQPSNKLKARINSRRSSKNWTTFSFTRKRIVLTSWPHSLQSYPNHYRPSISQPFPTTADSTKLSFRPEYTGAVSQTRILPMNHCTYSACFLIRIIPTSKASPSNSSET